MKRIRKISLLVLCWMMVTGSVSAVVNETNRLYGMDRYKTASAIAQQYNNGLVDHIVLVPGTNFANALPASVLAYKNKAPLLLVGSTASSSKEAFDYIQNHLTKIGTVFLVGDLNLIGSDFVSKLAQLGYNNVVRIQGSDKYETDYLIAQALYLPKGKPVVISSGEKFPDALAISSFAAANGWPILLSKTDTLSQKIKEFITEKQPSQIYITGGTAVMSSQLEEEVKALAPLANIQRFAGDERCATAVQIAKAFAPAPSNIYVSSGLDFPDALVGSVLAAKNKAPIILVNPLSKNISSEVSNYLAFTCAQKNNIQLTFFGGTAVISSELADQVAEQGGYDQDPLRIVEQQVVALVNKERSNRGLQELTQSDVLSEVARVKSQDMVDKDYFAHQSPTYGSPFDMMNYFGIIYSYAGENLAWGQDTAEQVVEGWMNSPGHRGNILKEEYQEIGIGVAKDSAGRLYWTQMFIKP